MVTVRDFVLRVIIGGAIFALLYWLLSVIPLPQPFNMVALYGLYILAVFFLIDCLLGLVGKSFIKWG